jgi:hypothetical protein
MAAIFSSMVDMVVDGVFSASSRSTDYPNVLFHSEFPIQAMCCLDFHIQISPGT